MDDDQILARGGTQDDINTYAKQNGADLTKEDFLQEERERERQEVVKEIEWEFAKEPNYNWTFTQIKEILEEYLLKKGGKK